MNKSLSKILLEKMALEKMLDYKFESTFWEEFSIAENYGRDAVKKHYDLVFSQCGATSIPIIAFVMVLLLTVLLDP